MKVYIKKNNELSSTFNQFLNIQENSADYRRFVAEEYQQQVILFGNIAKIEISQQTINSI